MNGAAGEWPALPLERWRDTYATLHMWTQIAGKICLAFAPKVNHFWAIAFQVTPRGLVTPTLITEGRGRAFSMIFDLVDHRFRIERSDGESRTIPLEPRTVADFYRMTMDALRELGITVKIWPMPVEIPDPIRFTDDVVHRSYDRACARAFLETLLSIQPVFQAFRCGFIGKCSPVHFFWGSFDLAVTRFSGRRAPERPDADAVTRESYSHEVISHGFWPGSGAMTEPAFYAYAAPEPPGFKTAAVRPDAAHYSTDLMEYILPYEAVRRSPDPAAALNAFMESTYEAGATLGAWDRVELERR